MKQIIPVLFLIVILTGLAGCMQPSGHFNEAVSQFDKKYSRASVLYFYPAVINTLNLTHDSTYTALVQHIDKFRILQYSKDSIDPALADSLVLNVKNEHFVDIMQMQRDDYRMNLLIHKSGKKINHYVLVAFSPDNLFVVDLVGEIPFQYIPALMTNKMSLGGIESVLNYKSKPRKKTKNGKNTGNK
ncbi:MAG: DUF4252 domain-containing protein [Bacteroidales bacterium]|nr:DUF4252 domain-containing protein [Bacteroidales bacterium]